MFFPAKTYTTTERLVPYTLTIEETTAKYNEDRFQVVQSPTSVQLAEYTAEQGRVAGRLSVTKRLSYFGAWPNSPGRDLLDVSLSLEATNYSNEPEVRIALELIGVQSTVHLAAWVIHLDAMLSTALFFRPESLIRAHLERTDPERAVVRVLIALADQLKPLEKLLRDERELRKALHAACLEQQKGAQQKILSEHTQETVATL